MSDKIELANMYFVSFGLGGVGPMLISQVRLIKHDYTNLFTAYSRKIRKMHKIMRF